MTDLTLIPGGSTGAGAESSSDATYTSFSRLSTYLGCARKFRLRYIDHAPEVPQGSLIGGSVVHAVIQLAEENRWWDIEATTEAIRQQNDYIRTAFLREFARRLELVGGADKVRWGGRSTKEFPDRENADWWEAKGPSMVMRACSIRRDDRKLGLVPHESGAVETEVRARLPTGLEVKGYIDALLMVTRDGEAVVRDWKTGSHRDDLQLMVYAWLLEQSRGIMPARGQMCMLRQENQPVKEVAIDPNYVALVPQMFAARAMHLELDEKLGDLGFMPNPSSFCGACTVAPSCPVGQSGWWKEQFAR